MTDMNRSCSMSDFSLEQALALARAVLALLSGEEKGPGESKSMRVVRAVTVVATTYRFQLCASDGGTIVYGLKRRPVSAFERADEVLARCSCSPAPSTETTSLLHLTIPAQWTAGKPTAAQHHLALLTRDAQPASRAELFLVLSVEAVVFLFRLSHFFFFRGS